MLLSDLKDLGLPQSAGELKIIRRHRLAPSFSAYEEDERGRINDNGRKLRRIVYRWNGRFYAGVDKEVRPDSAEPELLVASGCAILGE